MKLIPSAIVVAVFCLAGCSLSRGSSAVSSELDDRLAIYSEVIETINTEFVGTGAKIVLVRALPVRCYYQKDESLLWPALESAQATATPLTIPPVVGVPVLLISESELKTIGPSTVPIGWPSLTEKYPLAQGVVEVSAVGFDSSRSRGLVAASVGFGQRCGIGGVWEVAKENDGWRIDQRTQSWKY